LTNPSPTAWAAAREIKRKKVLTDFNSCVKALFDEGCIPQGVSALRITLSQGRVDRLGQITFEGQARFD